MTPTLARAQSRAKTLGLRTYRIGPNTYKVECQSGECVHRAGGRWHTVTIAFDEAYDRCDCEHGVHLYRGICRHRGAVTRRRDFVRPVIAPQGSVSAQAREYAEARDYS